MNEATRCLIVIDQIFSEAEFFDSGTNDLTPTTFGISRDDSDKFLKPYVDQKILPGDPLETIRQVGDCGLMKIPMEEEKTVRPDIQLGICGEYGGEPTSVVFCHQLGLDSVSCSLLRVPISRLAAA
jgi:pyruvate,orthophosphate dikinase